MSSCVCGLIATPAFLLYSCLRQTISVKLPTALLECPQQSYCNSDEDVSVPVGGVGFFASRIACGIGARNLFRSDRPRQRCCGINSALRKNPGCAPRSAPRLGNETARLALLLGFAFSFLYCWSMNAAVLVGIGL